jgi:hypothetical protein
MSRKLDVCQVIAGRAKPTCVPRLQPFVSALLRRGNSPFSHRI